MNSALRPKRSDESGFSLLEMLVAVLVFSVFLTIVLASMVGITRASSRAQLLSRSSSNILLAFESFDRQLRYANAINFPGVGTSGAKYVEFRTAADSSPTHVITCTQWRFDPVSKSLQYRTWPDVVGASISAWDTKIQDVVDFGTADYPFKMIPASLTGSSMQQMVLTVSAGTPLVTPGAAISSNFVARNSSIQSPSNSNVVVPGKSDTPVCLASGNRP